MKFTFICEDAEEGTKISYECDEVKWSRTLLHYHQFLNGCGFLVDPRKKLELVDGDYDYE
jgi:hypothetical protein